MEEKEVVEKRTVRREDPVNNVTSVNVGADGVMKVVSQRGEARNRGRRCVAVGNLDFGIQSDEPVVHRCWELAVPHHTVDIETIHSW